MLPRVLIVADRWGAQGFGMSFGPPDPTDNSFFTFSHLQQALAPYATITKAHRQTDPQAVGNNPAPADIQNFRFDQVDLSQYDQVWLVGYNGTRPELNLVSPDVLSEAELALLSDFMNKGGGIYAAGDHEGLGLSLAGRVPRVRSMRKWWWDTAGPYGEPVAPPSVDAHAVPGSGMRLDTTQYGPNDPAGGVLFDNQSDDIPQFISPWGGTANLCYAKPSFSNGHPILQGSHGLINQIADHMHEGEVIVPSSFDQMFSFNNEPAFPEYPSGSNGVVHPQIIAWSWTNGVANIVPGSEQQQHVGDDGPSVPKVFGALGVYDGFAANVGRVVVESTWHHFLDINLIGDPIAPAPKNQGFLATTDGQAVLKGIERLYRNIVYWLSPQLIVFPQWTAVVVKAMHMQPLAEILSSASGRAAPAAIGEAAVGTLRHVVGPNMLVAWAQSVLPPAVRNALPAFPWGPTSGTSGCGSVDHRSVMHAALGGAILAVDAMRRHSPRKIHPDDEAVRHAVEHGTMAGVATLAAELERHAEGMARFAHAIRTTDHARR